jgi:hypothetical protein
MCIEILLFKWNLKVKDFTSILSVKSTMNLLDKWLLLAAATAALLALASGQDLGRLPDDIRGLRPGEDKTWQFRNRLRYNKRYDHPYVC